MEDQKVEEATWKAKEHMRSKFLFLFPVLNEVLKQGELDPYNPWMPLGRSEIHSSGYNEDIVASKKISKESIYGRISCKEISIFLRRS